MRWKPRRQNKALERAQREVDESAARADEELATSRERLSVSREVAARLRRHNIANRYDSWLEQLLRGTE